jgi:hypothetical protein
MAAAAWSATSSARSVRNHYILDGLESPLVPLPHVLVWQGQQVLKLAQ